MSDAGWMQLLRGWPWFQGGGSYPLAAYSEFMPPPRVVRKPYGATDPIPLAEDDPWGWPVTEYEEALTLRPGLEQLAREVAGKLIQLGRGDLGHGIPPSLLEDNPCWPNELARRAGKLRHERFVVLLPLALSRTEDDNGHFPWTLFGASEQGPGRAFWKGFFTAPGREVPEAESLAFVRRLLEVAYGETEGSLGNLYQAGFRVLPQGRRVPRGFGDEGPLPAWTEPFLWAERHSLRGVRYLLTFRPFARLPAAARRAYLRGELHLLPFPGSLIFWAAQGYQKLRGELPFATQVPLLQLAERREGPEGIRVPQSGWMQEPDGEGVGRHGKLRGTYKRTHRHPRARRHDDPLASAREDRLAHVLFSTSEEHIALYNKPKARNVQLWTDKFRLLLDGPRATPADLERAAKALEAGGQFGYRFQFPAMRVGRHELYWHRPLVAYAAPESDRPTVLPDAPTGYLTAYRADEPDLARPVELWPRLLRRDVHLANIDLFQHLKEDYPHQTLLNVRKLLDTHALLGRPLPRSLARQLLTLSKDHTLAGWLESLPVKVEDEERARWLAEEVSRHIEPEPPARRRSSPPKSLTYRHTARRSFEVAYWNTIALLSAGAFTNKNNADCVLDPPTQKALTHHRRDLDPLGDYLMEYHARLIDGHKMKGKALVGEVPFVWETDFAYPWMGGWLANRQERAYERDLVVVIPGRDRGRAVLMADHYDTAYMSDRYQKDQGGDGARLAAPGADDNGSAMAALMLAAPVFLELSRAGKLACDVWLVHLTGEEFPAESLGARWLARQLVEGTLDLRLRGGGRHDLSGVRVEGVFVLDMIAHNGNQERDVFQISPGATRESMELACHAHAAAELWNASVPAWNRRPSRRGCGRGRRTRNLHAVPPTARHPWLHGEVRPAYDPRSTLYNADARIFADAGVPAVLLMENYDINRSGYHDSQDTLREINLDYGAALAAIAIEAVARAASGPSLWGE